MAEIRVPSDPSSCFASDDPRPAAPPSPAPSVASRRPSSPPADPARDLAGALHDVSNALTVVLGWIERARDSAASPEDLRRALDVAASRAREAHGIVRVAIGAEVHRGHDEAASALVVDALTGVDPDLRRRAIDARAAVSEPLASRRVPHAASVRQILTNLLLNAAAMSPPGGVVHLDATAAPAAHRIVFSVADAGPGIPDERRESLFSAGVSTRAGGAGIGLRHAAALARSLGGELTLAPSDRGARFDLAWPLVPENGVSHAAEPLPEPHRAPRALPLEGMRVLLVEDDAAVIDLLDTALTARGADVTSVRHRRDLDRALGSGRFDAALFDLSPIQDDIEGAVSRARAASGGLRVVMISGSAAAPPAFPEGWIAAWVRKPFEIAEIVASLTPSPVSPPG